MENLLASAQSVLSVNPERWLSLARGLPQDLFSRPAAPGEWSALQCLEHIIETEESVFPPRVEAFLAGRDFAAFFPPSQGANAAEPLTPLALAEKLARLRTASLEKIARLTPADLERRARHAELGRVTLGEMLHEWAGHDLMHLVQAERALMQPFIQGCGPWLVYFTDHVAKIK